VSDSFEKLRGEFLAETGDTLAQLQRDLNRFAESEPKPELVDRVFRTIHSLKGVAGMFGLDEISSVAHALENVFEGMREGTVRLDPEWIELLFRGNEILHALLDAANDLAAAPTDAPGFCAEVDARVREGATGVPEAEPDAALRAQIDRLSLGDREALRAAARAGLTIAVVDKTLSPDTFDEELNALTERVRSWGTVHGLLASESPAEEGRVRLFSSSERDFFSLLKAVRPVGGDATSVTESPALTSQPDESGETEAAASAETFRVPVGRIDRLLEELSDLLQSKLKVDRAALELMDGVSDRVGRTAFLQALRSMDRKVGALRDEILRVRMVTLDGLFQKLERSFREACRVTGKSGRWITVGENVEIDKHVVERMTEALVHLVRNAVDHGLETPEARAARGKPPIGTVQVLARSEGGFAVIEIADDGAGLDFDAIERRARARGLLTSAPTQSELLDVIFRPGFTVREQVTTVSGRGVGLDVVRQATLDLGGLLEVRPETVGTRFRLRIPTTLAITQALHVGVADESFFVPLDAVRRVIEIEPGRIETLGSCAWITDGDKSLPIGDLGELLRRPASRDRVGRRPAVVVGTADGTFVLLVDWLGARQEIVVRPLSELVPRVPAVSGSTQLGDGRTVLILDPSALARRFGAPRNEVAR
jgi:two-component system chemotaxis sensor kinase CheA